MFGRGISQSADLLDLAVAQKIVEKSGAWFSYNDLKIGQGRENSKKYLKDHPSLAKEIKDKILQKSGLLKAAKAQTEAKTEGEDSPSVDKKTGEIIEKAAKRPLRNKVNQVLQ